MNLKESFRYQKFLDGLMNSARYSVQNSEHALKITRIHNRSQANPEAEDMTEEVTFGEFYPNDSVLMFMTWLVSEREKLSNAISLAKRRLPIDIDAAVETNKFRQSVHAAVKSMLRNRASKAKTQGKAYRFDVNGVQAPYYYDVDVIAEEAYDREAAQTLMRQVIQDADRVSAEIDAAMINVEVDYIPKYDVNDSFEDVMAEFIKDNPC